METNNQNLKKTTEQKLLFFVTGSFLLITLAGSIVNELICFL